jgi:flavoprotein
MSISQYEVKSEEKSIVDSQVIVYCVPSEKTEDCLKTLLCTVVKKEIISRRKCVLICPSLTSRGSGIPLTMARKRAPDEERSIDLRMVACYGRQTPRPG